MSRRTIVLGLGGSLLVLLGSFAFLHRKLRRADRHPIRNSSALSAGPITRILPTSQEPYLEAGPPLQVVDIPRELPRPVSEPFIDDRESYDRLLALRNDWPYLWKREQEVVEFREATRKAFRNPDGTVTVVHKTGPIHYKDAGGEWREIPEILKPSAESDDSPSDFSDVGFFVGRESSFEVRFPRGATASGIEFRPDARASWTLWKRGAVGFSDDQGRLRKWASRSGSTGRLRSLTRITYENTYPAIDEDFCVTTTKVKHGYVLRSLPRAALQAREEGCGEMVFSEFLELPAGLSLWADSMLRDVDFRTDDAILLKDFQGAVIARIPRPVVFEGTMDERGFARDHAGNPLDERSAGRKTDGSWRVEFRQGGIVLHLLVSLDWLARSDAVYPIVVDPTLYVNANLNDAYAYATGSGGEVSGAAYLKIGDSASYASPYKMGGMRFMDVKIPQGAGARITSATLTIYAHADDLSGTVYGRVSADDVDNSAAFGAATYLGDRPRTATTVIWDHSAAWTSTTAYASPDISGVLSEVVNRAGWAYNNELTLIYYTRSNSEDERFYYSYEGNWLYSAEMAYTLDAGTWLGGSSTAWGTTTNWAGSAEPGSSTDVYIYSNTPNAPSITTTTAYENSRDLTLYSGATLTFSGNTYSLRVYGNLTNNGTITGNAGTDWEIGLDGLTKTVGGTGTWTNVDAFVYGTYSCVNAVTFKILRLDDQGSGGDLTLNGQTVTVTSSFNNWDGTLIMTNAADVLDVNGTVTWSDGADETVSAGTIRCSGNWTFESSATTTITLTGTNVVEFDGTGTQTIYVLDSNAYFDSVIFKDTGSARTIYLDTTSIDYLWIGDDLTIEANCTFDFEGTVAASNVLQVDDNLYVYGSITMDDADDLLFLTDTYWYSGSSETISLGTIQIQGQAYFYSGSNFTPTGGLFFYDYNESAVDNDVYVAEATNFNFWNVQFGDGTYTRNIKLNNANVSSNRIDINGNLTISANATVDAGAMTAALTVEVAGLWTNNGTFTASGTSNSTVIFDGAGAQVLGGSSTTTFYHLTLSSTSGSPAYNDLELVSTLTQVNVSGNMTVQRGGLELNASDTLNVDGNITIATDAAGIDADDGSITITVGGDWSNSSTGGVASITNAGLDSSGSTVIFDGAGAQAIKGSQSTTFDNLTLDDTGSRTITIANTAASGLVTTVSGTFTWDNTVNANAVSVQVGTTTPSTYTATLTLSSTTVGNSTITIPANKTLTLISTSAVNVKGNWTNSGTFTANSGTVTFNAAVAQTISGTITGATGKFYNLTINNSYATPDDTNDVDPAAAIEVAGTLTVTDGQFQPAASSDFVHVTIQTNGILKPDASVTVTVSGNWSNSGTFTPNTGTVKFDGSGTQTVTGTTTFYKATIANTGADASVAVSGEIDTSSDLTFEDGRYDPNGTTADVAGNLLTVDGTVGGTIAGSGTVNVAGYLTVTDVNFELGLGADTGVTLNVAGRTGAGASLFVDYADNVAARFRIVKGTLNLTNTSASTEYISIDANATFVSDGGAVNISVSVAADYNYAIENYGTLDINGGAIVLENTNASYSFSLWNYATFDMSGGTFTIEADLRITSTSATQQVTGGTLTVNGWIRVYGNSGEPGATFILSGGIVNCGTLYIYTAGSYTGTIYVRGGATVNGAVNVSYTNGTYFGRLLCDSGSPTLNATSFTLNGAFNDTGATAPAVNITGNFTRGANSTLTSGTATFAFTGSVAQSLALASLATTFYKLTVANTAASPSDSVDVDPDGAIVVSDTLAVNDGQFSPVTASDFHHVTIGTDGILKPDAAITVSGHWTNGGNFTHNSGTVTFDGTAGQAIQGTAGTTFNNVTFDDTGNRTITMANTAASGLVTTVSGTFTWDNTVNANAVSVQVGTGSYTATLTLSNATAANSTIAIPANKSLTTIGASAVNLKGNWTNDGTYTAGSGSTVTFDASSGTQTIGGSANTTFSNLALSNNVSRQFGNNAAAKTFTVSGTLAWNDGNIVVGQSGIADKLYLSSTSHGTLTAPASRDLRTVGTAAFHLRGSSATNGIALSSSATLALGSSSSVTCEGDWTINSGSTFNGGSGTANFNGSGTTTSATGAGESNFGALSIGSSHTLSVSLGASGVFKVAGNFSNAGVFTHNVATDRRRSGSTVEFNGTTALSGAGTFTFCTVKIASSSSMTSTSGTITLIGHWINNGTFTHNSGTVTMDSAGATQAIQGSAATTFNVLNLGTTSGAGQTINLGHTTAGSSLTVTAATLAVRQPASGTNTVNLGQMTDLNTDATTIVNTLAQTLAVTGSVTINTSGALGSVGSSVNHLVNVAGNWTNNQTFTGGVGTVTFNGSGSQSIGGTASTTFANLTIANSAADDSANPVSLSVDTIVSRALSITNGRLRVGNARTLTIGSDAGVNAHSISADTTLDLEHSGTGTATLNVGGGDTLTVNGTLDAKRESTGTTDTSTAAFGVSGAGTATISIGSGQAWIKNFTAGGTGTFVVQSGGRLVDFSESTSCAWSLNLASTTSSDRARIPYALSGVAFTSTGVVAAWATPSVWMFGGSQGTPTDPGGKVHWVSGAFGKVDGTISTSGTAVTGVGTSFVTGDAGKSIRVGAETRTISSVAGATSLTLSTAFSTNLASGTSYAILYDTLEIALSTNPTGTATIRMSPGVATNYQLDVNAFLTNTDTKTLENFVFAPVQPSSGTRLGIADGDGDTSVRCTLRNCIVARGGLSEVAADNCTFFPLDAPTPLTTSNLGTQRNCIRMITAGSTALSGNNLDVRDTDAATYFLSVGALDYHLRATASLAIDDGADLASSWSTATTTLSNAVGVNDTVITVASTSGFPNAGRISIEGDIIFYSGTTGTTFTNVTGITSAHNSGLSVYVAPLDVDGNPRPFAEAGSWDIGADEYFTYFGEEMKYLSIGSAPVTRLFYLGTFTRLGVTGSYAYGVSGSKLSLMKLDDLTEVTSVTLDGNIVYMTYWQNDVISSNGWETWIYCAIDENNSGYATAFQCVVDKKDGGGFVHPTGDLSDSNVWNRRFWDGASAQVNGHYVWRPGGASQNRKIRYISLMNVISDGPDGAPGSPFNNPSGTNLTRWLRGVFVGYNTSTSAGEFYKLNTDPGDALADGNGVYGDKIYDLVSGEGSWRNFEWDAPCTFTWGEQSTRLFVPCSNTTTSAGAGTITSVGTTVTGTGTSFAATDVGRILQSGGQLRTIQSVNVGLQTLTTDTAFDPLLTNAAYSFGATQQVVVRFTRDGLSETNVVDTYWQALEEAAAADECMGLTTDNGGDNANITYCLKDGLVVYNRKRGAANNYGAIRHAAKLPSYPVTLAQRIWGTNYVLVGVDGGVHKIFDNIGSDTDPKNGCLASTGEKVAPDDNAGDGIDMDTSQVSNTKDLDWPLPCIGKPVGKLWVRQTKIYWITDQGYLYGYNWNRWGDSLATGDETPIPGYPLNFGSPIRSMYLTATKLIVGLDNGAVVEVKP